MSSCFGQCYVEQPHYPSTWSMGAGFTQTDSSNLIESNTHAFATEDFPVKPNSALQYFPSYESISISQNYGYIESYPIQQFDLVPRAHSALNFYNESGSTSNFENSVQSSILKSVAQIPPAVEISSFNNWTNSHPSTTNSSPARPRISRTISELRRASAPAWTPPCASFFDSNLQPEQFLPGAVIPSVLLPPSPSRPSAFGQPLEWNPSKQVKQEKKTTGRIPSVKFSPRSVSKKLSRPSLRITAAKSSSSSGTNPGTPGLTFDSLSPLSCNDLPLEQSVQPVVVPKISMNRRVSSVRNTDDKEKIAHLEKNRIAALDSRRRKKEEISELEIEVKIWARRNREMQSVARSLEAEMLHLRAKLSRYNGQGYQAIDRYLDREADGGGITAIVALSDGCLEKDFSLDGFTFKEQHGERIE